MAINRVAYKKARDKFLKLITHKKFQIPMDVDIPSENETIQKFLEEQELILQFRARFQPAAKEINILGLEEDVRKAMAAFSQFFERLRLRTIHFTPRVGPDVSKFLEIYFYDLKKMEKEIKNLSVSVKLEKQSSGILQFTMTGLEKNISSCRRILEKTIKKIVSKDESISYPGLKTLFDAKKGKDELATIERKWKVIIVVKSQEPPSIPTSASSSNSLKPIPYDGYNFTTDKGIKFSCKIGRIEHETVSLPAILREVI